MASTTSTKPTTPRASIATSGSLPTSLTAHRPRYGKVSGRCAWPMLPSELLCTIAFYLLSREERYVPDAWHFYKLHRVRSSNCAAAYTAITEVRRLGELMSVCQGWSTSLEKFPHWQWYINILDPHALFLSTLSSKTGRSASLTFSPSSLALKLLHSSCWVCRINSPDTSTGVRTARKLARALPPLPIINSCKTHSQPASFCSVCLAGPMHTSDEHFLSISENEDTDTWPGADATCRGCRQVYLRAEVSRYRHPRYPAVDFVDLKPRDWEAKHVLDTFIFQGEGLVSEVLATCLEKDWYQSHTKVADILDQALAANRLMARDNVHEYESEDELLSEDEEDPDMIALTEEQAGVKEAALHDWSRQRILDGHWFGPLDLFCRARGVHGMPIAVPATHPCSWLSNEGSEGETHPTAATVQAPHPPTYHLAEFASRIFAKAMRQVLRPAMENIVRRLVIECEKDGVDVVRRASSMALEEVVEQLRDAGVWHNGVDWIARREREHHRKHSNAQVEHEGDQPSPTSSVHSMDATSPVLSTTTIRTTPSPEPTKYATLLLSPVLGPSPSSPSIPVAPVLASPIAVHSIPYIPDTIEHLPPQSRAAIEAVWREASSILYRCSCKTCDRATRQLADATQVMLSQVQAQAQAQARPPPPPPAIKLAPVRKEVITVLDDEEEQDQLTEETEMVVLPDEEEEEEPEVVTITYDSGSDGGSEAGAEGQTAATEFKPASTLVSQEAAAGAGRKRQLEPAREATETQERAETPPKRIRTISPGTKEDESIKGALAIPEAHLNRLPARLRKRTSQSQEAEGPAAQHTEADVKGHKRARTNESSSP